MDRQRLEANLAASEGNIAHDRRAIEAQRSLIREQRQRHFSSTTSEASLRALLETQAQHMSESDKLRKLLAVLNRAA